MTQTALDIRLEREAGYHRRARKIVDRVMPEVDVPNAFFNIAGYLDAHAYNRERGKMHWRTFARLRAKAEGVVPYINLPKGSSAIQGSDMWHVAKELELAAAPESYVPAMGEAA